MPLRKLLLGAMATAVSATLSIPAFAQTEIQFWHAFTGRLGELVAAQVETFNNSQNDYTVVASHKGNYSETLNAGIAASNGICSSTSSSSARLCTSQEGLTNWAPAAPR